MAMPVVEVLMPLAVHTPQNTARTSKPIDAAGGSHKQHSVSRTLHPEENETLREESGGAGAFADRVESKQRRNNFFNVNMNLLLPLG